MSYVLGPLDEEGNPGFGRQSTSTFGTTYSSIARNNERQAQPELQDDEDDTDETEETFRSANRQRSLQEELRDSTRRTIVKIKNDNLKFEGDNFNIFLKRFERTAEACGASDWDKVMQIDKFVMGEELLEELEAMEGYEERKWKVLKRSMQEAWGDLFPTIKYTTKDLVELANDWKKRGGLKDLKDYKDYASQFSKVRKYLLTNRHIGRDQEIVGIFLVSFSKENQRNIKRELIKGGKITYGNDGYCIPPNFNDLLLAAEIEMKADSEETFGNMTIFSESNKIMQKGLNEKKNQEKGKFAREKMVSGGSSLEGKCQLATMLS